jgi:hypothetical protein
MMTTQNTNEKCDGIPYFDVDIQRGLTNLSNLADGKRNNGLYTKYALENGD